MHVFQHLADDPSKTTHSVFDVGSSSELLDLIDEGWANRGASYNSYGSDVYEVNLSRVIGTQGQQIIRIVVRQGTNIIRSAYPIF